jgi:hypothetical protein
MDLMSRLCERERKGKGRREDCKGGGFYEMTWKSK